MEISKGSSEEWVHLEGEPVAAIHWICRYTREGNHSCPFPYQSSDNDGCRESSKVGPSTTSVAAPSQPPPSPWTIECREATDMRRELKDQLWSHSIEITQEFTFFEESSVPL